MSTHPLDERQVVSNLFFPRKNIANMSADDTIADGSIVIEDDIEIGYRLHILNSSAPILLYFHGNGEIASDYQSIAPYYHAVGINLNGGGLSRIWMEYRHASHI